MKEIVGGSIYFGFFLTIGAYYIGLRVRKRLNLGIFNPLLIAIRSEERRVGKECM